VKKIVYKICLVVMKKLKKKKEDSGLEVANILVVKLKILLTLLLLQLQLLLPLLVMMKKLLVTMKKLLVTMKKKKKNFTDSSQKLKETGLTICPKLKNKMMDYSIVTLLLHSNILIICHLALMIPYHQKLMMKLMT